MLGNRMERDNMIGDNDKIDLKNKLNICGCIIFECKKSKSKKVTIESPKITPLATIQL
jgi:hypothetical protein